uniref:Uncharacterized protein n=1 Tax=viral metagenome TaxID=1070528 RepID=A0A6H1ZHD2_9ZZZZ
MEDKDENLDSTNEEEENADSENGETEEQSLDVLQKEKTELSEKNKQLFERTKKAESEAKKLREQLKAKEPDKELENSQSNEPDYSKLAFLEGRQVSHPDDQKLVIDEAVRLKLPLTDILGLEYIKAKLQTSKEQREAESGTPAGRGKAGGGTGQKDVDYWIQKGELPKDQELAAKVVNAKMQKDDTKRMFDPLE